MNKDTIAGSIKETGGKMRSKVGHALGDTKGEVLGRKDQFSGSLQKNFGKVKDKLEDIDDTLD